jgi:hypothetical protein
MDARPPGPYSPPRLITIKEAPDFAAIMRFGAYQEQAF